MTIHQQNFMISISEHKYIRIQADPTLVWNNIQWIMWESKWIGKIWEIWIYLDMWERFHLLQRYHEAAGTHAHSLPSIIVWLVSLWKGNLEMDMWQKYQYLCAYLKQAQTHMFIKSPRNHVLVNKTHFFLNSWNIQSTDRWITGNSTSNSILINCSF